VTAADVHRRVVLLSVSVVDRVTPADLDRPTPCAAWTVRDLLTHMTAQHRGFAAAARGAGPDPALWSPVHAPDPVAAYREAAASVLDAFADPADEWWLAELTTSRPFPAAEARGFHLVDYVAHAWDVAVAVGAPYPADREVAEAALAVARAVPAGAARERPESLFAPVVVARPADAPSGPLDETLRLLGRDPQWTPSA
jgi:uncharacterized protein (TIGR03086 family)